MGLSGRELLLVLRARDEATRSINRLSAAMSRADRSARADSEKSLAQARANMEKLSADAERLRLEYQKSTLALKEQYLQDRKSKANAAQLYQERLTDLRRVYLQQRENALEEAQAAKAFVAQERERIAAIDKEREHIKTTGKEQMATGAAMVGTGVGLTYMAAEGIRAYANLAKSAMDYQTQARLTWTQIDKQKYSLQEVEKIGKNVARSVPVPFEQIQPALYDVFSSIDVGAKGAQKLLKQFAKDSVAGMTSLEVATRADLEIMNAYKIKTKDVSKVSDFMFKLVQKGVGTYSEFASVIGRAIPSAVQAGQSYKTVGVMMAFLTRQGLSAAMASSSAARALDAMSNPKVVQRLKKLGINAKDAQGEFRPLADILGELQKKWKNLPQPQKTANLLELLKGAGSTIQARRFFNEYFRNSKLFNELNKQMADSSGQAKRSFDIMAKSPQAEIQRLKNDFKLLEVELGTKLIPIALKVVSTADSMIKKFDSLSPSTKRDILYAGLFVTVLMGLSGILLTVAGSAAVVVGSFKVLGIQSLSSAGGVAKLTGGLALLTTGLIASYKATSSQGRAVGVLSSVMGGAAAGSIFGPWGTAIGATIGLAGGLVTAFIGAGKHAKMTAAEINKASSFAAAKQGIQDLTKALQGATNQYNSLSRAAVSHGLRDTKTGKDLQWVQAMQSSGVSRGTIVDAALGDPQALKQVRNSYSDINQQLKILAQSEANLRRQRTAVTKNPNLSGADVVQQTDAINTQIARLQDQASVLKGYKTDAQAYFGDVNKTIQGHIQKMRELASTLRIPLKEYEQFPKAVRTKFEQEGIPQTNKRVAQLIKQYHMTPKQLKTLVSLPNINLSRNQLEKLLSKYKNAPKLIKTLIKLEGTDQINKQINGLPKYAETIKPKMGAAGKSSGKAFVDQGNLALTTGRALWSKTTGNNMGQAVASAKSAASKASSAGYAIDTGMIAGINAGSGIVAAAAAAVANRAVAAAKAALKSKSPSKKTRDEVGKPWSQGFALGIENYGDLVAAASRKVAHQAIAEAKKWVKDMQKLHIKGYHGPSKPVWNPHYNAAQRKQYSAEKAAWEKHQKDFKGANDGLQKMAVKYAKNFEKVYSQAETRLQNLTKARNDYVNAVKTDITSYGSFSSLTQPTDVFGNTSNWTASNIQSQLSAKLSTIKKFGSNLKKLLRMGFSATVYNEAIQMGVEDGAAFVAALVQATPRQVRAINSLTKQTNTQANSIGKAAGYQMYGAGIQAANGLIKGLKAKRKALIKAASQLGSDIAKAVKKALGIKSPSRVAIGISDNFGGTMAKRLYRHREPVRRASLALARQMMNADVTYRTPVVGAKMRNPQVPTTTLHQEITVNTHEINPRKHAAELGWQLASRFGV